MVKQPGNCWKMGISSLNGIDFLYFNAIIVKHELEKW